MSIAGRRVVVTRTESQSGRLAELLAARGAVPVLIPLISVIDDESGLDALARVNPADYEWIVVTSPNGGERLSRLHPMVDAFVGAVGPTTAVSTPRCDFVPAVHSAAGFVAEFAHGTGRVLVVQAANAAPVLVDGLTAGGWRVDAVAPYRTAPLEPEPARRREALEADAVLLASGSAAVSWAQAFGAEAPAVVVAIGPQTAAAAKHAGLTVTVVAEEHSLPGIVDALESHFA
jgi:uroporphyrinogen-III synthase